MTTYVTATGLIIPTLQEIKDRLGTALRANVDPNLNIDPDSPDGQEIAIYASVTRELWEVVEDVYHGLDPDAAEDALLDYVASITGTERAAATPSRFTGTRRLFFVGSTHVTAGMIVARADDPSVRFITTADSVTITGAEYAPARSEFGGPFAAPPGTVTVIVTPQTGITAVTNLFDPTIGTPRDGDPELRIRRERELLEGGGGTYGSMKADVAALELEDGTKPTLSVEVFENTNDTTNLLGLPPHSFEVLTWEGPTPQSTNNDVAQLIWDDKPLGIATYGNTSGTAIDAEGNSRLVFFSRPVVLFVKVDATYKVDAAKYAGDVAAREAIRLFIEAGTPGPGEIDFSLAIQALLAVAGVKSVQNMNIQFKGTVYGPGNQDLVLPARIAGSVQVPSTDITLHPS